MAFDVFLSYSSKDKTTADAACAALENTGIRCWIAPRDIIPGMDWGEAIVNAIGWALIPVGENQDQALFVTSHARADLTEMLRAWCHGHGRAFATAELTEDEMERIPKEE